MGAMCRLHCDQATKNANAKHKARVNLKCLVFLFRKKSYKAETNGSKMIKFGSNVTQTALKGLNLAQTGNYEHVLNLKYTCRALPSCLDFGQFWTIDLDL